MKKSKRYIKKQNNKPLINKKVLAKIIRVCWHGGLFEHKNNVLTGRYFNTCLLYEHDIDKGWMPKETIYIDCVEVEISSDNWIMSVDADNTDLLIFSCNYSIQWKECSCLKGIRLEDVTVELEEEAYKEMRNNK